MSAVAVRLELLCGEAEGSELDGVKAGLTQLRHAKAARDQLLCIEAADEQLLGRVTDVCKRLGGHPRIAQLPRLNARVSELSNGKLAVDKLLHRVAVLVQLRRRVAADAHLWRGVPRLPQLACWPMRLLPFLNAEEDLALLELVRGDPAVAKLLAGVAVVVLEDVARRDVNAPA